MTEQLVRKYPKWTRLHFSDLFVREQEKINELTTASLQAGYERERQARRGAQKGGPRLSWTML